MSDKIKKITIRIELDGTAEEEKNLRANVEATKQAIAFGVALGLSKALPEVTRLPVAMFATADLEVVRTEPDTQTTQAE